MSSTFYCYVFARDKNTAKYRPLGYRQGDEHHYCVPDTDFLGDSTRTMLDKAADCVSGIHLKNEDIDWGGMPLRERLHKFALGVNFLGASDEIKALEKEAEASFQIKTELESHRNYCSFITLDALEAYVSRLKEQANTLRYMLAHYAITGKALPLSLFFSTESFDLQDSSFEDDRSELEYTRYLLDTAESTLERLTKLIHAVESLPYYADQAAYETEVSAYSSELVIAYTVLW